MVPVKERIIRRLEDLRESRLHEVLDFVEFLAWKEGSPQNGNMGAGQGDDPILAVAGSLSFAPMTNEEIDQELYGGYRAEGNGP